MSDRPYTDADVETVATAIEDAGGAAMTWGEHKDAARAVLDALTAAGWLNLSTVAAYRVGAMRFRPSDVRIETHTTGGDHERDD